MVRRCNGMTGLVPRGLGLLLPAALLIAPKVAVAAAPGELEPDEFLIRRWTREDGLPHRRVQAIQQTPDGFLWVGTAAGLARFDGVRFRSLTRTYVLSMPDDNCLALMTAGASGIWLGSPAGLARYDGDWESAALLPAPGGLPPSAVPRIESLAGVPGGVTWAGTDAGLWSLSNATDESAGSASQVLQSPRGIRSVALADGTGSAVWVAGVEGIHLFGGRTAGWRDTTPESVLRDGDGAHLVLGSEEAGFHAVCGGAAPAGGLVWRWSGEAWEAVSGLAVENAGERLRGTLDANGDVWLTAGRSGLLHLTGDTAESLRLPTVSERDVPLALAAGWEGSLWVGMSEGGLLQLRPRRIRVIGLAHGLPHARVNVLASAGEESVWIGSEGGLTHWPNRGGPPATDSVGAVRAMACDPDGRLWLACTNGLRVIAPAGVAAIEPPEEWSGVPVRAIHCGAGGRVWLATAKGVGCFQAGNWSLASQAEWAEAGGILAVFEDRSGQVWAAPVSSGMWRLGESGWKAVDWGREAAAVRFQTFHEDGQGSLWLGSNRGLFVLRDGDKLAVVRMRHGLPDDEVLCILHDEPGNLWVRHGYGIYRASIDGLLAVADGRANSVLCVDYGEEEGLGTPDLTGSDVSPDACRDAAGRLWFPSASGAVVTDPNRLPDNPALPLAVVEEMRVDGLPWLRVMPGRDDLVAPYHRYADLGKELVLPMGGAAVLEIGYTAPTFVAASECLFSYRLQGVDRGWTAGLPWRTARYSNLAPGRYVFELRAVNAYGVGGPVQALRFRIPARYYQSVWFQATAALAVWWLLWRGYRWRLAQVHRVEGAERNVALLRQRMKLARDLHDGLGANLTQLTLLAGTGADDDAKAGSDRLRQVSEGTREAATALREIIWATHPEQDTVRSLVNRVEQTAIRLCEAGDLPLRTRIASPLPDTPLDRETRLAAFYVAKEALNNLVRHAGATEAHLSAEVNDGTLKLAIADNGQGFDPDSPPPSTSGHGLPSMVERLKAVGGRTEISSSKGQGTTITLTVPLASSGSPDKDSGGGKRRQRDSATK